MGTNLIQPEEAKRALQVSGYLLESRVAQVLDEHGLVETNTSRIDPRDPTAAIEIDVHALVAQRLKSHGFVSVELFIECKNNAQPVAFIMHPARPWSLNENIKYGGFPMSSADPVTKQHVALPNLLGMMAWHHYCKAEVVATQFCGFSCPDEGRKGKNVPRNQWRWKAESMQNYSKSFADLCIAVENEAVPAGDVQEKSIEVGLYYPIVVFQGPIYAVTVQGPAIDVSAADHIQLVHSTSLNRRVVRAQIDVVSESALPSLIATVKEELGKTVSHMNREGLLDRLLESAIDQKRVAAQRRFPYGPTPVV
jgi:hypothetical protein